jgi:hypothetical protein
MSRRTKTNHHRHSHPSNDIGPELVVALARQIPTLENDALVRIITTSEQVTR